MSGAAEDVALWYAGLGWAVLPVQSPGKVPLTRHGLNDATCDPNTIKTWWRRWPIANVGIARAQSGLVALDIDPRHGGDETFAELEERRGQLPDTVTAHTGGGGLHLLFEDPGGSLVGSLGPGVHVRANAYIVVEPSLHESGGYYEWAHGRGPDEIDLASLPEEWIQALSQREATSPDPTRDEDDRIPEGKRNTVLTSLAGTMRHRGMSAESIEAALLEDNRTRCDPPLDSEEVRRLASSVGRYAPDPASRSFARTDLGNAERLVARHGQDLRYTEDGRWLAWDGTRWLHDNTGEVTRRMKQTVRSIRDEPVSGTKAIKSLLDFARRSEAESRVKAAIGLAKSDPAIIASGASFDVDPMAGSRSSVHLL